jgi:hypothetical protein
MKKAQSFQDLEGERQFDRGGAEHPFESLRSSRWSAPILDASGIASALTGSKNSDSKPSDRAEPDAFVLRFSEPVNAADQGADDTSSR